MCVCVCVWGGAHLSHLQCLSLYLGCRWGRGSSALSIICLQYVSLYLVCMWGRGSSASSIVSLPHLGYRWGRGSSALSTICLSLPGVSVGEGLICIIHSVSPSILCGGGGGARLHPPYSVNLTCIGWRWGRGTFALSTMCLPLPWVEVGDTCIIHSVCTSTMVGDEGRSSIASSIVCLPLPWVEVGEGLICIVHSESPST